MSWSNEISGATTRWNGTVHRARASRWDELHEYMSKSLSTLLPERNLSLLYLYIQIRFLVLYLSADILLHAEHDVVKRTKKKRRRKNGYFNLLFHFRPSCTDPFGPGFFLLSCENGNWQIFIRNVMKTLCRCRQQRRLFIDWLFFFIFFHSIIVMLQHFFF